MPPLRGTMNQQASPTTLQLLTVKDFARRHSWPIGGLRHLLFYRPDNFERCVLRVGRKVLIDEAEFFRWIRDVNQARANAEAKKGGRKI